MKQLDYPPVWLAIALAAAWFFPFGLPTMPVVGYVLVALAFLLAAAAVLHLIRGRTTIVPHRLPDALVTGGVFSFSRNPIYLADLLILAGCSLAWGSLLGPVLVPVLAAVLKKRFILGEESRLRAVFGTDFDAYTAKVRRWL